MAIEMNNQALFKPAGSKAETKAETTNQAARSIISDEVNRREAKTAKLREARLQMEADAAAAEKAKPPVKKTARSAGTAKRTAKTATPS